MSWITNLRISAEELNDHFISETYVENTQESLTEQRFLEDLDHDDAGVRSTNFFKDKQNWELREAHEKSLNEMEELRKCQSSTFDNIARRSLVEDRDTILKLSGRIQDLQNEISCIRD